MTVGITFSAFDLLHAGHIAMLKECKQFCDYLIVGLHVDPSKERTYKNKPVQSLVERYSQLKACKYVDEIIPYQTEKDLEDILYLNNIDIRFIGEEYKDKEFTGKAIGETLGISTYFNSRKHSFSSSELRSRIINGHIT